MIYYDVWDGLPKTEEEFWRRLEESFGIMVSDLMSPMESREDALKRTDIDEPGHHYGGYIRHRATDDRDNLIHFHEKGLDLLGEVEYLLEKRKFTQELFIKWGNLMFCHGWISNAIFSGGDDLVNKRGGLKSGAERNKDTHRVVVSRMMLPLLNAGKRRKEAERIVVKIVVEAIAAAEPIPPLELGELAKLLDGDGKTLKSTYGAKKLTKGQMEELLATQDN